ncbi:hypothetical protein OS493_033376 [Desmophyllum pertusum]|uniref:Uncharacterized protein n=1 Tax=Desmophyllum pertusum TaxID=174260 RepID=A0A9W9YVU6_9CNID|nr:hypothetical protein OS493_033376 [Desmophyllum pertusum]
MAALEVGFTVAFVISMLVALVGKLAANLHRVEKTRDENADQLHVRQHGSGRLADYTISNANNNILSEWAAVDFCWFGGGHHLHVLLLCRIHVHYRVNSLPYVYSH